MMDLIGADAMSKSKIKLFEERQVRAVWDEENEKWWFSVVDVVSVLTEQADELRARKYWNKLKQRLKEEGNETVTNCHQLKMSAKDGKRRLTDAADTKALEANIREQEKAAHDLEAEAGAIDAAVYDLKAVNPNAVTEEDERTPEQIIASIGAQGQIVAQALGRLSVLLAAGPDQAFPEGETTDG